MRKQRGFLSHRKYALPKTTIMFVSSCLWANCAKLEFTHEAEDKRGLLLTLRSTHVLSARVFAYEGGTGAC